MTEELSYTPEEVAGILKISRYTVYELVKRGELTAFRIGRKLRIQSSDLSQYIKKAKGAENMLDAEIQIKNDCICAKIVDTYLNVVTNLEGKVKIIIEPESIILAKEIFKSSARNVLHCKVVEIIQNDSFVTIKLDATFPLVAFITNQALKEMDLHCGEMVYAIFKATAVQVYK